MKDRTVVTVSSVVLALALVGGGLMLVRARRTAAELTRREERIELLALGDDLRAQVADLVARRRITALVREQPDMASFRIALSAIADGCADDPLDGQDSLEPFVCTALDFEATPENLAIWTSSPLHPDDQIWVVETVMQQLSDAIEGGAHELRGSRVQGTAWAAFRVEGRVRIAALFWQSPRGR